MSNITDKISNTTNSYIGGAKQTVGNTIGNPTFAAEGAAQKAQADTAQKVADTKVRAEGVSNSIQGNTQQTLGSILSDPAMKAEGDAKIARGEYNRILTMTERMQNTASQIIGGAKQSVGEALGKPDIAASGAAQKSNAEAAQRAADARTQTHGVGHSIEGQVQQTVGAMTNDPAMQSRGVGNEARSNVERNV
ncbi:hypothetical protein BG011_000936 [Mortierella polycephala]|uniref:Uncharacterized protein n=1 Tax=Mortierella polycephala TaxID=41804 RepID=A0A9P6QA49_9FUNG|nr:hypothetical protein BG011_000936 [Mortierella polycephala]